MKNQATNLFLCCSLILQRLDAGCKQLDIQLQSLVSYLISSRVGLSQELDLTRLDILDIGSGQDPIQPNLLLFDIAKARC